MSDRTVLPSRRWWRPFCLVSLYGFVLLSVILALGQGSTLGLRRLGNQVALHHGRLVASFQRIPWKGSPPKASWEWFTGRRAGTLPYAKYLPSWERDGRFTELAIPLSPLLAFLAIPAMIGWRILIPPRPGPYRLTFRGYVAGLAAYLLMLAVASLTLIVFAPGCGGGRDFPPPGPIAALWFLTPVGSLFCAEKLVARRNTRFPSGHCWTCRYDLTGNVSGVCPECGTRIQRR